jgi:hypothetical protein
MANDVASSFPQVDLTPNTTITVTLDQAGAKITGLAVHGYQEDPDQAQPLVQPGTAFAFGDNAA